jgi:hypothetical protein
LWHAHLPRVPLLSARQPVKTDRTQPRPPTTSVATQPSPAATLTKPASLETISHEVLKPNSANTDPQKAEVAQRKEPQESSRQNDPKLVSMLKTTWRVMKKPFKF